MTIATLAGSGALLAVLLGVPIGFALMGACAAYLLMTGADPSLPASTIFGFLNKSELVSIPFFILAAEILGRSGATDALVEAAETWFGRLRNGLAIVTLFAIMVFSAISGSSVATAIAIGRVMIPKLIENGYDRRFSLGLVAAAGGLGILIPPSVPLIVYATIVEISVGDLFLAAFGPGLLLGLGLCAYVTIIGDKAKTAEGRSIRYRARNLALSEQRRIAFRALPMLLFPTVILGGIYGGIFTPTEAAAFSVVFAVILSLTIYRQMTPRLLWGQATDAGTLSASILVVMGSSALLSYIIAYHRIPADFATYVASTNIGPTAFLLAVSALLFVLGCFLEIISVILIVVPIIIPALRQLDINLIHFGILLIVNMELGVITPPIGMNLFVVSGITRQPVTEVFLGTIPFILVITTALLIFLFFPGLSLFMLEWLR